MADLAKLSDALQAGKREEVAELTQQALEEGTPPDEILNSALIQGMNEVGEKFKQNEVYIPEVLIAARAMHAALDILRPKLVEKGIEPIGKILIGTVRGDLHDIGKNLVGMMFEGGGFEVIDLGSDVSPEKFVKAIEEHQPQVVAMSALLTTTMPAMKETIEALVAAGARDKVVTMVGGAPLTQKYADEIGADCYAPDAPSAVDEARKYLFAR